MTDKFNMWRPHPWHGLSPGPDVPGKVDAYLETTPFDRVKYEVDPVSGYLRVDRPQKTSSLPPMLYGFIPRTYCGKRVGDLCPEAEDGDGDALDICVISECSVNRAEVLLSATVIGGISMIDRNEADDKIVAVLVGDLIWGETRELRDLPGIFVDRLKHYFTTYKELPGEPEKVKVTNTYGRSHAMRVITAALDDYRAQFG